MAEFTPGPWLLDDDGMISDPRGRSGDDSHIAHVYLEKEDPTDFAISTRENKANAHLIAAAPCLHDLAVDGSMNVVGEIMQNYADQLERAGFGRVLDLLQAWDEKALEVLAKARGEK